MYKLSIILPIFNVEKYIKRALNSILNQTMDLKDIEVIMVDDCSTDNTKNIVEEYEKKCPNFKAIYLEKNSGGAAHPRNIGMEIASGEYLMFLDPDDEYDSKMCEILYNKIKDSDAEIVKCNHKLITEQSSKIDYQFDKNISEVEIDCKTDLPPETSSVCNAIHKREFLVENKIIFPTLKVTEDVIFSLNEFFNANKIIIMNNYAGYYYYSNEDISHSKKPTDKNISAMLDTYWSAKNILDKHNRSDIYFEFFSNRCTLFFLILLNHVGNKKEYFKSFYEFEKKLGCTLIFKYSWINIVNKFLIKNKISTALFVFDAFNLIRKTPIIKIYRKFL